MHEIDKKGRLDEGDAGDKILAENIKEAKENFDEFLRFDVQKKEDTHEYLLTVDMQDVEEAVEKVLAANVQVVEGATAVFPEPMPRLARYPVDMAEFISLSTCIFDSQGVPYEGATLHYNPLTIAHYALMCWNNYLIACDEWDRRVFLAQASWLVANTVKIAACAGGWVLTNSTAAEQTDGPVWLSASIQGVGLSVLMRAFLLTRDTQFLLTAQQVAQTFRLDILDGGICAPVGSDGLFFEEIASYPAMHLLQGCLWGMFGLYDYLTLCQDEELQARLQHVVRTLDTLLPVFDAGYWTYQDVSQRLLASPALHHMHLLLLDALDAVLPSPLYEQTVVRWRHYAQQQKYYWRYRFHNWISRYRWYYWLDGWIYGRRAKLQAEPMKQMRVSASIHDFPNFGGVGTVLRDIVRVMDGQWHVEYLTQHVCASAEEYTIYKVGSRFTTTPWHFPFVWFYVLAGILKYIKLSRSGIKYDVLLPQDAVIAGALAGIVGKLLGMRVVCIDHGDLSLFTPRNAQLLRAERIGTINAKRWPWLVRFCAKRLLSFYWPSRLLLARIAARYIDAYLIPGVPGDSVDEGCQIIGIAPYRVTRYNSMIDVSRHPILEAETRCAVRKQQGIAEDAIVVAIICRLAPEKGIRIALESVQQVLSEIEEHVRERVRVVIAGDGPLHDEVEQYMKTYQLEKYCICKGALKTEQVVELLSMSDIFLYTSLRGACMAMAVVEAMAAGCAVVSSTEPYAHAVMLADERGCAVPAGDSAATSAALKRLLEDDELRQRMGRAARAYVEQYHSSNEFKRTLQRATYWAGLVDLLHREEETVGVEMRQE